MSKFLITFCLAIIIISLITYISTYELKWLVWATFYVGVLNALYITGKG